MYGLPPSFDPQTLVGQELGQICIGQSDLILNFEPDTSILVTSAVVLSTPGGSQVRFGTLPEAGRELLTLLGDSVASASATGGRALALRFRTGAVVEILDDSDQFESFTIRQGSRLIVV